jgi:hypothetical protein
MDRIRDLIASETRRPRTVSAERTSEIERLRTEEAEAIESIQARHRADSDDPRVPSTPAVRRLRERYLREKMAAVRLHYDRKAQEMWRQAPEPAIVPTAEIETQ